MNACSSIHGISRRVLLSALAGLPTLSGSLLSFPAQAQTDPLPSWNDGPVKTSITSLVTRVTTQGLVDMKKDWKRVFAFQ